MTRVGDTAAVRGSLATNRVDDCAADSALAAADNAKSVDVDGGDATRNEDGAAGAATGDVESNIGDSMVDNDVALDMPP